MGLLSTSVSQTIRRLTMKLSKSSSPLPRAFLPSFWFSSLPPPPYHPQIKPQSVSAHALWSHMHGIHVRPIASVPSPPRVPSRPRPRPRRLCAGALCTRRTWCWARTAHVCSQPQTKNKSAGVRRSQRGCLIDYARILVFVFVLFATGRGSAVFDVYGQHRGPVSLVFVFVGAWEPRPNALRRRPQTVRVPRRQGTCHPAVDG